MDSTHLVSSMSDNAHYPRLCDLSAESTVPAWAQHAQTHLTHRETLAGPVSSKVEKKRWGFTCSECRFTYHKTGFCSLAEPESDWHPTREELVAEGYEMFPARRCSKCDRAKRRWKKAKEVFVQLDLHRMNIGIDHLRFVTLTHKDWNQFVPFEQCDDLPGTRDKLKSQGFRKFRNWRNRNSWWRSREAIGQMYPECTITPVWEGWGIVGMKLHFHIHCILVSKYLDNKPQMNYGVTNEGEAVFMDHSRFHKEWGGIVDVRAVKDYQVKYQHKGVEHRGCGRKACMRYLVKYISKADHWRSAKLGKW